MIRGAALAITAACMAAFLCAPAWTHEIPCSQREKIVSQLQNKYREAVIMRGIVSGSMMELFYSPSRRSWTVLVTRPDGTSCLILGGENAQLISPSEAPPEGNSI